MLSAEELSSAVPAKKTEDVGDFFNSVFEID